MKQNQPIKRSASLTPLSHDHHHGLVISRRMREGLKRNIQPGRINAYVRDFWEHDLQRHFGEEEAVIFPLLGKEHELVHQALTDHEQMRRYMQQLTSPGTNETELLRQFAELLQSHIRFEERTLFPEIERLVPGHLLTEAGKSLHQGHSVSCVSWEDEFWLG